MTDTSVKQSMETVLALRMARESGHAGTKRFRQTECLLFEQTLDVLDSI